TSQIEPSSISFPFRFVFRGNENIKIRMAEVVEVSPTLNKVFTSTGELGYDYLIVATGCKTNFFNNASIEKHSFTLKSTYDAISIRNQIISVFEKILTANEAELEALFNLVIVGAGPTGVELAG